MRKLHLPHVSGDRMTTQIVVILSPESKEVDADTSDMVFGPFLRDAVAGQLDDTLIDHPSLQFEEDELVITSITRSLLQTQHL